MTDVVHVHLFAAARAAAGAPEMDVEARTLGEVLERLVSVAPAIGEVLPRCSFLIDGIAATSSSPGVPVPPGGRVDVLPPFAGG